MAEAIQLLVDQAQQRIEHDRQATLLDGTSWRTDRNANFQKNTWIDPVTRSCILLPNVMESAFDTTFSGRFARFRKADYSLVSPTKWVEAEGGRGTGDWWLESLGVQPEWVVTSSKWKANQGFYLSWFSYNANISKSSAIFAGWFHDANANDPILVFHFLTGGYVDVFYKGNFERTYTLGRPKQNEEGNERGEQQQQEFTDMLLLPWRNREVMILPAGGDPVVHVLEALSEGNIDPIIPKDSYFCWQVRDTQAKVQLAPVLFRKPDYPSGANLAFACAQPTTFLDPPIQGLVPTERAIHYGEGTGDVVKARLMNADNSAPYVADGSLNSVDAVIRVDFTDVPVGGDTLNWDGELAHVRTPYVYGAEVVFDAVTAPTDGAEKDLLDYCLEVRLSVERDQPQASLSFTLEDPDQFEAEHPYFTTLDFRPVQLRLGPNVLFEGVAGDISYQDAATDKGRRGTFRAKDAWQFFESYMLSDVVPLDGLELHEAVRKLAEIPKAPISMDIPDVAFTIPAPGTDSAGNFHTILDVGETVADGLNRVREAFAANFLMGFRASTEYEFYFLDPDEADTTSRFELYRTRAEAEAAYPGKGREHVYRSYRAEPAPMEVTDIRIQGFDPHTAKPILAHVAHSERPEDPTTPVTGRTALWSGSPRKYAFSAKELTSTALIKRAARLLARRLLRRRVYVEFESEFMVPDGDRPVWAGDVVTLEGYGKVRILALEGAFRKEPREANGDEWQARPFTYAGELLVSEGE